MNKWFVSIYVMYYIDSNIHQEIIETIGNSPIESGGIIGIKNNIICKFYFDKHSNHKNDKYIPNVESLNNVILDWYELNIEFIGIVHSHPNSCNIPSLDDLTYAKKLKQHNPSLKKILFPIVTKESHCIEITFYEFDNDFSRVNVKIINKDK